MTYILGVSPFHDSSACLLKDGLVHKFYKEERLSRIKRDNHPFKALQALQSLEVDLDYAVICSPSNGDSSLFAYSQFLKKTLNANTVLDISDQHHLQHASLAFYNSGFSEALVVVIDRNGSFVGSSCRESESVFYAEYPHSFTPLYKSYWYEHGSSLSTSIDSLSEHYREAQNIEVVLLGEHGIVRAYESATTLIQEHVLENGKTMGLSAYGSHRAEFDGLFIEGVPNPEMLTVRKYARGMDVSANKKYYDDYARKGVDPDNHTLYSDYAYAVQRQTQEAALRLIERHIERTGIRKVCVTGGYALNVLANSFYKKMLPEVEFYFEPMADDTGNSIGGAMLVHRELTQDTQILPIGTTFFHGDAPDVSGIVGPFFSASDVVDLIIKGKSVAIFEGQSEAGPRALGHRSILSDARMPDAKERINVVKNREWYRPFAAIVLLEDAHKYFDMIFPDSKYMMASFDSTPYAKKHIPGVLHIDGTCRIQTITSENSTLFELLSIMKEKTNHGVLLNTSFNLAGEPLVETVDQALDVLKRSSLDFVWFPEIKKLIGKN